MSESVAERYDRDWLNLQDDRKVRGLDYQDADRREREYVDPETGETATATGDNNPDGFDQTEFEAGLAYNPNA